MPSEPRFSCSSFTLRVYWDRDFQRALLARCDAESGVSPKGSSTASQMMSASVASDPVPVDPLRVLRSVCSALDKPPGALSPQRPPP